MYKTDFICTYQNVQDEEIINNKYRDDLLDILDLEIFDEKKASERIDLIVNDIQNDKQFQEILKQSANRYMSDDNSMGLTLLFSFDTLHIIHECIKNFYLDGKIKKENYDKIIDYLNK
jgi:hypothetical protein